MNSSGHPQDAESLRIALDAMPVAVSWARLSDLKIVFMNRMFTQLFGFVPEDFSDVNDWIDRQYPFSEDRADAAERWGNFLNAPPSSLAAVDPIEIRVRCKDGSIKTVINSGTILPDSGWALATFVDISGRKRNEIFLQEAARRARESQAIYQTLLNNSPEMIVLAPFNLSRRYVSPAVTHVTGFSPSEYLALKQRDVAHPDDLASIAETMGLLRAEATTLSFRYRALRKDGSYRWVEAIATSYLDLDTKLPAGVVATVRDIHDEIERQESLASEHRLLAEAAVRDELTGIPNRRAFNQALACETTRLARAEGDLSLLLIDIDHFKLYNDHWGHLEGDTCLRTVAQTIDRAVGRANDLVARFGGEEFVVLLPMTTAAGAAIIAQRVLDAVAGLKLPHPATPAPAKRGIVTVSIGATTSPAGVRINQDGLLELADRALYTAKAEGRNTFRFLASQTAAAA